MANAESVHNLLVVHTGKNRIMVSISRNQPQNIRHVESDLRDQVDRRKRKRQGHRAFQ